MFKVCLVLEELNFKGHIFEILNFLLKTYIDSRLNVLFLRIVRSYFLFIFMNFSRCDFLESEKSILETQMEDLGNQNESLIKNSTDIESLLECIKTKEHEIEVLKESLNKVQNDMEMGENLIALKMGKIDELEAQVTQLREEYNCALIR